MVARSNAPTEVGIQYVNNRVRCHISVLSFEWLADSSGLARLLGRATEKDVLQYWVSLITITEYLNTPVDRPRAVGQLITAPFDGLLDHLLSRVTDHHAKGAAGYWVAAPCPGPRSNAGAGPTRVVALDYDDAPTGPDWIALAQYQYVAHTTDSHTALVPRWRMWILLDREYTAAEVGRAVCPLAGAHLRAISQPAYIPTVGDTIIYAESYAGTPLALEAWWTHVTAATPPATPRTGPRRDPSDAARNALVCRWFSNPDGTNRLAGALGATLAEWGWADADVQQWMAAWLSADPRLAKHVDDALRGAAKRRAGDRIVGFPVLDAELGAGVWAPAAAPALDIAATILEAASNTGQDTGPFRFTSARAAAEYVLKPVNWLSEQLVMAPGAPSLITGYGGSGKTTFVQHLALAVATPTSGKLLGQYPVRHGSVAHIDHEQGLDLTTRRYRAQGLTGSETLDFCSFPNWRVGDVTPEARAHFVRICQGRALVIIDSFLASCSGYIEENSSDTREPLDFLGQVSDATGAIILVIHHSKKDRTDAMVSARGTSAITDAVSLHITYEKTAHGPTELPTLKIGKTRHEPPCGAFTQPLKVAMIPGVGDAGAYTLAVATGPSSAEERADFAVATAMAGGERFTSLKGIREAAGLKAADSDAAVRRAIESGDIMHQNGKYFYTR